MSLLRERDVPRIDVHQHMWTPALLERLAARTAPPMITQRNGLTMLHSDGEQPYVVDVDAEDPARRADLVHADGLDLALIAISSPIGVEALPREQALAVIDGYLQGVAALGPEFAAWGPLAIDGAEPDEVDALLDRGCIGISAPSGALAGLARLDALHPVLERVAARGVPLFVHPGRAPGQHVDQASLGDPTWWTALTGYVSQMQAAWLTFAAHGRREHPELIVVFTMLAGGAPLLSERLGTRGGPTVDLRDPRTFYETSSYGPAAVEMMARRVGEAQLLYGSDRPVVEPTVTGREAILKRNAGGLLIPARLAA